MEKEPEIVTVIKFGRLPHDNLWVEGTVVDTFRGDPVGQGFWFQAKVYSIGSKYGINKGRVSKLTVRKNNSDGAELVNYDRGWDIRPKGENMKGLLKQILDCLEDMEKYEE